MTTATLLSIAAFLACSSLVLLISQLVTSRRTRLDARLQDLSGLEPSIDQVEVTELARVALPRVGKALVPSDEKERKALATRLIHAGLYSRQAMPIFFGAKLLLTLLPLGIGLVASGLGLLTTLEALLVGGCLSIAGIIGPSFWLDRRKSKRQTAFRRSLPDALDILVICLEGGLSLPGSLKRVSDELHTAHPLLAHELHVVQREIQLGLAPGEALQKMAERTDLEEMRSLAAVIIQADRFGASLIKSLRVHAETLRVKRMHRAEERAQKAATKLLFPTIIFIFPNIFLVVLGPAMIHLLRIFRGMGF